MLIACPECNSQISDKAVSCPHCGYPMKKRAKMPVKQRLPNGFGSITCIKNRRLRKPYLARVTVGKNEFGKPIVRNLKPEAYFKTYNDAYKALIDFNLNPYTFDRDLTVQEALRLFLGHFKEEGHSDKRLQAIERAINRCKPLYDLRLREIRPRHIKECMEKNVKSDYEKATFKQMWNRAFDYAIEYELADHNYARDFKYDDSKARKSGKKSHSAFTDEEFKTLWNNSDNEIVRMILVQSYMGWRPNELCSITLDAVHLDEWYITGGSKTEAGMNRIVPIHSKIRPFIRDLVNAANKKFLFTIDGEVVPYHRYHYYFGRAMRQLGLSEEHKPHDPRKQFVTMAKRYGVDEYVIKLLVGHTIADITEAKYTDRNLEWLRSEIEKIRL